MIIIKNAELENISKVITTERSYIQGLKENLAMIQATDSHVRDEIFDYIKHNAVINGIAENIRRNISNKHDIFQAMNFALDNAEALIVEIEARLKKSGKKIFDTKAISYREKGMFDWLNSISFYVNYTSKLIDIILTQPKTVANYLTKADFEFINKTVGYYNTLTKRLTDSRRNLVRSIDMLSDEQYDPEYSSIIEDAKGKEATTVGLMPHELNPDYWRRYIVMRWDVRTIKVNQEKIDMYAAKLQRLESQRNGQENPSLDAQIEKWQNEIQILDAEIREIEEKYAE